MKYEHNELSKPFLIHKEFFKRILGCFSKNKKWPCDSFVLHFNLLMKIVRNRQLCALPRGHTFLGFSLQVNSFA